MNSIDFKSAVIGLLLGVCVMLVLGAGGAGGTVADVGRYRVSAAGDSSTTCFIIDTATDRTWRKYPSNANKQGYVGSPKEWDN